MIKINEFTISLHCGYDKDIVNKQMEILKPLEKKYKIHWNNRIDRYPYLYPSYSQLLNHVIASSSTEWIIMMNDRLSPTVDEVEKVLYLLENGYSCVYLFNIGFFGLSKELIRKIGWFDEEYYFGGWEDRELVYRLKEHDLCFYESLESTYDMICATMPKSPLNGPLGDAESAPRWNQKYTHFPDFISKNIPDPKYEHWNLFLGKSRDDIRNSWKKWSDSTLNIMYNQIDRPGCGPSASSMIANRDIIERF